MPFRSLFFSAVLAALSVCSSTAFAAEPKLGVLMLHGKNPGDNRDPNFRPIVHKLEREGWVVRFPNMPWASTRYLEGHWDLAMTEIGAHVKELRAKGAEKIVLMGHSLGVPAAMSYAARGGDVQALVLLAPGHIPVGYYRNPRFKVVHDSVNEARALVTAGKGAERGRFNDINQGRQLSVSTTASDYLSYFDPTSDAEMSVTAPRIPSSIPVLSVVGDTDPLFAFIREYYVDKLPANPQSRLQEVKGTHLSTPEVAYPEVMTWMKLVTAN
jgi:pimeloyl-ACP methyl ester carboxylesterase